MSTDVREEPVRLFRAIRSAARVVQLLSGIWIVGPASAMIYHHLGLYREDEIDFMPYLVGFGVAVAVVAELVAQVTLNRSPTVGSRRRSLVTGVLCTGGLVAILAVVATIEYTQR